MAALAFNPMGGTFSRSISASSESMNTSIDQMELPFENDLKRFVIADEENIGPLITDIFNMLDDLRDLNVAMLTLLLDPTAYDSSYASSIITKLNTDILANQNNTGTGLPATTETNMWNRGRSRILQAASRTAQRISEDISKRLPYGGMMADKLTEADQDIIRATEDLNWQIAVEQEKTTYQFQRDKIKESMANEQLNMGDWHTNLARKLQAYTSYDEINLRNHWNNFEVQVKQIMGFTQAGIDFALKAAGGSDQISFGNYLEMSKLMAEGQLRIGALISDLMPGGSLS